jgi:hypothetical protein
MILMEGIEAKILGYHEITRLYTDERAGKPGMRSGILANFQGLQRFY